MPLTMSTPVAQLLKEGTACAHREAEEILNPRIAAISSYDDYASLLRMFYGYFHPLERVLSNYITPEVLPDISERRNSQLIVDDLQSIGHPSEELPLCHQLPKINSPLAALGAMYVLEGSSLGGRMLWSIPLTGFTADFSNFKFANTP